MLKSPIYIDSISSISSLGHTEDEILKNYRNPTHLLNYGKDRLDNYWSGRLPDSEKILIDELRNSNSKYRNLDPSVLFAIFAARLAVDKAGWDQLTDFGINIGSSRGATSIFEKFHEDYLSSKRLSPLTSPTTTLGNISSWVAQDLMSKGPEISHSITCSTSLHSVLNGIAWLQSGMCNKFLVGGSEAPLTKFTIEQMKALRIYSSKNRDANFPCQALDIAKTENTMLLGEAAGMACLSKAKTSKTIARIVGFGYATELLEHNTSLSTEAECFQKSMRMAIGQLNLNDIDAIITHCPGTVKGDFAELSAISKIFGSSSPALTNNKWKIGHSLGASGIMSLQMAALMLKHQEFFSVPYLSTEAPDKIQNIMVNAVGFGGNAVSLIVQHLDVEKK